MKSLRFWVVLLLLSTTAVMLHFRTDVDYVPPSDALSLLPTTIGPWTARDIPLNKDTLSVLGEGRFLNRIYTDPNAGARTIGLFIGYFPTQRNGQSIHSPQNCLPGAGWTFASSQYIDLKTTNDKSYRMGEYLITNGPAKEVVLYWYLAHGRSIANDYLAKAYMMVDAIRWNRTDGALIRVVTPLQPNETLIDAQVRAQNFARQTIPLLPRFIPD